MFTATCTTAVVQDHSGFAELLFGSCLKKVLLLEVSSPVKLSDNQAVIPETFN